MFGARKIPLTLLWPLRSFVSVREMAPHTALFPGGTGVNSVTETPASES